MILEILLLIIGILGLVYLSPYVVKYSTKLGEILKISPIVIGIIAIAIGTSIPEISTSITSSVLGHGDINVGDIVGSSLSQITLILGSSVLISGTLRTESRKNLFILGSGVIISSLLAFSIIEKGYISRLNGALLIVTYIALNYILINSITQKEYLGVEEDEEPGKDFVFSTFWKRYALYLSLSLLGIIIASLMVINSVVILSDELGIAKYLVSYIAVGLGTSLPELFVGISAVKSKNDEVFIGNILGSNITDLTLCLGIGPLINPNYFDPSLVIPTGNYLIVASTIVVLIFGINKKIDRKTGVLLILLYFLSFVLIK